MTVGELLARLRGLEVKFWAEGDRLRLSAPQGVLTTELRAELAQHKAQILAFLRQLQDVPSSAPPLVPVARDGDLPLSYAQQRLWLLNRLDPASPAYHVPIVIHMTGRLNVVTLARSLNDIRERHEILRTIFVARAGQPYQVITPAHAAPLPLIDLQRLSAEAREIVAQRIAAEEARYPFALARGPLLRPALLRLDGATHMLLMTMHHIISDAWSIDVLMRELTTLYVAHTVGQPAALKELPIQYADYAVWQRAWLQGGALASHLTYWKAQLADPPTLNLPPDRPRAPGPFFHGGRHVHSLPPALHTALVALCRAEGVTRFMALLAAFQSLLARYSGQDDIIVGAPVAGRIHPLVEPLIGCFINTLALRTDLSSQPSFRALLARVYTVCLGAYAHQDLPFEQLVEQLQPARDLSRSPLFQAFFALQPTVPPPTLPELTLQLRDLSAPTAKFDLSLSLSESAEELEAAWEYRSALWDPPTIARLAAHFQTLLAGALADPDRPLDSLPLLSAAERQQLLGAWATGAQQPIPPQGVPQVIAAQAGYRPDAVALVFDLGTTDDSRTKDEELPTVDCRLHLSYGELDRRANRLARHLRALGVGPEVLVAICMDRCAELVIGILGVLKAGGAYLPLDPAYPAERISFMLEDSGAAVVITATMDDQRRMTNDESLAFVVRRSSFVNLLEIDLRADWDKITPEPANAPTSSLSPTNPAYVIYTSGSTGTPKGAVISHCGLANHMHWMHTTLPLESDDHVFQKTALSFDASVWEFYAPLMAGATLVLARPGGQQDSAYLLATILAQRVSILQVVPTLLRMLLVEPEIATCRSLRRVFCGGEALPVELAARCSALLPATELYNLYGPSEATIDATCAQYVAEAEQAQRTVAIGRPITNMRTYLLDAHLEPVPIGAPGELYIGGVGLARGYLGRPDLTAERFIPNPFSQESGVRSQKSEVRRPTTNDQRPTTNDESSHLVTLSPCHLVTDGTRLYKTGDLARYRADGAIEFLSRMDQQVKLRGFRVELEEITAVLQQHAAVHACTALIREDLPGDQRLVAYVVPSKGTGDREQGTGVPTLPIDDERPTTNDESEPSSFVIRHSSFVTELRDFLRSRLPAYMIPTSFVVMDALPLTPNGKIDRRALPAPHPAMPMLETPFVAPRTPVEELLASIWAAVLQVERVGVHDNFFDLGGHSLLVFQVISQVRRALHLRLPMNSLQTAPTIARLAEYIELLRWARQGADTAHEDAHAIREGRELAAVREERGASIVEHGTIIDFLSYLRRLNVKLWAEDHTLRYGAPPGTITPALQAELRTRKADILAFLDEAAAAQLSIRADQRLVTGQVPLTPVQRKFFAQNPPEPHHWNTATLIELPSVRAALVRLALRHVLQHHDGLRLRFVRSDAGWQQRIAELGDEIPFSRVDLAALPADARRAAFAAVARAQQTSLNLAEGPLQRVVLVEYGPSPAQLLVIVNHLTCDGFSLSIVLQDLVQAYRHLAAGEPVRLPPKTTSFKEWAEQLVVYAQSAELRRELDYWLTTLQAPVARLPVDRPGGVLTEANARLVSVSLTRQETARLNERLRGHETTITDVLLTALTLAFARWTGEPAWLIEMVHHGRETIFDDIDLSRTVGWLVSHVPVRLCVDTARDAAVNLQRVKAQLRQLPNRGFGFEVLRYLTEDVEFADALAALPQSQVIFNFLGHADGAGEGSEPFVGQPQLGPSGVHKNVPSFLLIFNGILFDDRLYLALTYSAASHDQRVIVALGQRVIAALRELL